MPALFGALAAALLLEGLFGVPLAGAWVLADVAALGALSMALIHAIFQRARRRAAPVRSLAVASVASVVAAAHLALAPTGPAVILVVVDCLRADRLSPEYMPKTWGMTQSSTRFARARSQSSWTRSAMPSLLSGRYPTEHGLYHTRPKPDRIRSEIPMLAELFSAGGWLTAGFVEQAQLDAAFGFGRGFGRYGFRDGLAGRLNQRFLRWNRLFRTVPRFVFLHYVDVHGPYVPKRRPAGLPESTLKTRTSKQWRATINDIRSGAIQPTADDYAQLVALYDGEVAQIDRHLDRLFDALQADGTLDAGWLVLTADHGERFGENGDIEHMNAPDETVLSVPLLLRPPGGVAERIVTDVVQHVDVAPTLLAAAGLPVPSALPGRDLRHAVDGSLTPGPSFAEEWYGRNHRVSVRDGDFKLLLRPAPALYDLAADPEELHDIAAQHPEVADRLHSWIAAYFDASAKGRPIAEIDWSRVPAGVWIPSAPAGEDAEPSDGTLEALERLGYLE